MLYMRSDSENLSYQQAASCQHELGKRQARLFATAQHRHLQHVGGNVVYNRQHCRAGWTSIVQMARLMCTACDHAVLA